MMATLTVNTERTEVLDAVKKLLEDFKVTYKIKGEKPYNPEFVAKIKQSEQQIAEGKTVKYEPGTEIWEILNAQ